MAKKNTGISKTQLIRDELEKNPNASPTEIAEKLKSHKVSAQYVSTIKFNMKKKGNKPPAKRGRKPGTTTSVGRPSQSEPTYSLSDLVRANKLAEELGGVDKAQELLKVIDKLN